MWGEQIFEKYATSVKQWWGCVFVVVVLEHKITT
jgi:hypothetical protein